MNNYVVLLIVSIYFLATGTSYFWIGTTGPWALLIQSLMLIGFCGLLIYMLVLFARSRTESENSSVQAKLSGLICLILIYASLLATGIIDYGKLYGQPILIAHREAGGNCQLNLKLHPGGRFRYRTVCFGIQDIWGRYAITGDSIVFRNSNGKTIDNFYEYGIIGPDQLANDYGENVLLLKGYERDNILVIIESSDNLH